MQVSVFSCKFLEKILLYWYHLEFVCGLDGFVEGDKAGFGLWQPFFKEISILLADGGYKISGYTVKIDEEIVCKSLPSS